MLQFIHHKYSNLIILYHSREFHAYWHCNMWYKWWYPPSLNHYNGSYILWEMNALVNGQCILSLFYFPHGLDVINENISKPAGRLVVKVDSNPSLRPKAFEAGFSNLFLPPDLMSLYVFYIKNQKLYSITEYHRKGEVSYHW